MAEEENDTLIQDTERGPIGNWQVTTSYKSQSTPNVIPGTDKPLVAKKKCNVKKPPHHKVK